MDEKEKSLSSKLEEILWMNYKLYDLIPIVGTITAGVRNWKNIQGIDPSLYRAWPLMQIYAKLMIFDSYIITKGYELAQHVLNLTK